MSSSYRNTLNQYLAGLELVGDTLIDCGGSQEKLPHRVKRFDVRQYLIADLPNPHENSSQPDIELDLNYPIKDTRHCQTADIVTCLEVLEYVFDPVTAFENIAALLKPGGIAYISFPSVYPLHQPIEDDALRYMPGGIKKLAKRAGLDIIDTYTRRPDTNLMEQFYAAERMRAARGEDHHFTGLICTLRKVR